MLFKGQKLGKYKVVDTIGSGGFGVVYLAVDTWIEKQVAIKVPHQQNEDIGELLKEPRLLATLDHPNVVNVITAEKRDGLFYIVMEYVDGESLEDVLKREKMMEVRQVFEITAQICRGVDYAHSHSIIHRDLRPANILMNKRGEAKIADFGTSRLLENIPYAKTRIGSPPYMAPEHLKGRAVFQSDIYSLGIVMYEMLTGNVPLFDVNLAKLERLVAEGKITPPKLRNTAIPKELSEIVMKALATNVSERYQRAGDLLYDMEKYFGTSEKKRQMDDIRSRLRAREDGSREAACWNCGKALPRRAMECAHCGVSVV
ncbi:MAG: serine/threonine-protein kinase [Acidobacteriota bacterium]